MKQLRFTPLLLLLLSVLYFSLPSIFSHRLPIPADAIVGLYHPYRDFYEKQYPRGVPFKNPLITDPVRQQYPWKKLVVEAEKKLSLPLWNPYSFAGTPLLANFQSSPFYPLNILYLLIPFTTAWSVLIFLQPLLAGIFLYLYLRVMRLSQLASTLGAVSFAFCGFSIAWLESNTIVHTGLWLPLILLALEHLLRRRSFRWIGLFIFSSTSMLLAGHLQVAFYAVLICIGYMLARTLLSAYSTDKKKWMRGFVGYLLPFVIPSLVIATLFMFQFLPTIRFIELSGRELDQANWMKAGWFIPWQHLIQFLVPDFFGNPATGNYWGVWNYAEFIGYIGIIPLILAFSAMFFRHDRKTLFFGSLFFLSLIFALPTFFAELPFKLAIPFLSSSQPTRLLFVTDFTLCILAALGLDNIVRKKNGLVWIYTIIGVFFLLFWVWVLFFHTTFNASLENIAVAKRNLIYSTSIFLLAGLLFASGALVKKKYVSFVSYLLIFITAADLLRFGMKFASFSDKQFLYPTTKTISFLQKNTGLHRIMPVDSRILPPNFSVVHKLQSVDGYDPLYLERYAELIAASERNEPNISPPFGFERIITPHNINSKIINLLGVKYILALEDIDSKRFKKVYQEGQTRVYENTEVLPRVFFVSLVTQYKDESKKRVITDMFRDAIDFRKEAIVESNLAALPRTSSVGEASIISYSENRIFIKTNNTGEGFLVLTDTFYPTWRVRVAGEKSRDLQELPVYRTDFNFRGVFLPAGTHMVEFYNTLF